MSVHGKLNAKFGVSRAGRSIISGAVERDWARSASGQQAKSAHARLSPDTSAPPRFRTQDGLPRRLAVRTEPRIDGGGELPATTPWPHPFRCSGTQPPLAMPVRRPRRRGPRGTLTMQGDFEAAIAELEKAIDLNPNLALAYYGLGFALTWSGRAREALPHFHKAIRQSPHDPALWTFETMTGYAHIQLDEYAAAVEWLRKAARHPNSAFWPNLHLAVAFVEQEESDKAGAAIDAALQMQSDLSLTAAAAMLRSLLPNLKDRYLDGLRKAGLPE